MLQLKLSEVGKRYQFEWVFKNMTLEIPPLTKLAVTGSNGSGKTTFLRCLSGQIPLTEGNLEYRINGNTVPEDKYYQYLTISAPYLELPEEFTLNELLHFHFSFKNKSAGLDLRQMASIMYLENSINKQILYFSSGMKQRVKLGLCFFSDVPLLLLDEPTSNLDREGISWYNSLIKDYGADKTILICSNDLREYEFCDQVISMEDYKIKPKIS